MIRPPKPYQRVVIIVALKLGLAFTHLTQAQESPSKGVTPCPPPGLIHPAQFGQASGYDKPDLKVGCTDTHIIIQSNGVPHFTPSRKTPNTLQPRTHRYTIPRKPREASEPVEVPFLGPIAVSGTGLPIYAPNEAADLGYGDAYLDGILDQCGGHVDPRGVYHFHVRPGCPYDQAQNLTTAVLGYAFDGYPIMVPYMCTDSRCTQVRKVKGSWRACDEKTGCVGKVRKLDSSWKLVDPKIRAAWEKHEFVPGLGDLDRCNGMTGPDGLYRYYATDTFPYNLGCYHGLPDSTNNRLLPGWSQRDQVQQTGPPAQNRPNTGSRNRNKTNAPQGHPDLNKAAKYLGVQPEQLRRALGPPPPTPQKLNQAARQLGIDPHHLMEALDAAR